ncbi:MAG: insulinase family protein, partial [Armatimonadetes bacterium]|nr:insulinase family protein [Candidatus Hippobium faecium]
IIMVIKKKKKVNMDNYRIDNVEEFVLDNGLRILIKENKSAPVFTCQLWFKVGSIDEPFGLSGSAHLIEHMLFRSSKNFKGGEISQILRGYGGIDNAATSYDYTYY